MMKPQRNQRKRRKGGGNKCPPKREAFPDLSQSQERLDDLLQGYTRTLGCSEAMNFFDYLRLEPQQAESPKSLFKLNQLISVLLDASPSAKVKYSYLKQSFIVLMQTWGAELFSNHLKGEKGLLAGRAADCVGVILSHWRRVTASDKAWEKFMSRLDDSQAKVMEVLRKKATSPGKTLKVHKSDVTVDSLGFPMMVATSPKCHDGDESGYEELVDGGEDEEEECTSLAKAALEGSPPPVLKKTWRAGAMKRPSADLEPKESACLPKKKPSAKLEPKGACPEKDLIHQDSLSIGGGKVQSYIQHQPGPGKNKRLVVAVTQSQASHTTKTHRELVELLLPHCKKLGACKAMVLQAREKLFTRHAK